MCTFLHDRIKSCPIKGGSVVTCIVDVDVTTTPDESGVGVIVDATGTEGKENNTLVVQITIEFLLMYVRSYVTVFYIRHISRSLVAVYNSSLG